jgi:hypothetical protein
MVDKEYKKVIEKSLENIDEFMDYWKGKSNTTILEMEDFIIASAEKKGWDIDCLKKFLEDTKANTEAAKKLQQEEEKKERARQGKEEAAKIVEGLKDVTNPEKIKEGLATIGQLVEVITPEEVPKAYTSADYEEETKNYDPDKYFCPKLFNAFPFPDGTLSVIGARTSRGKTTALINLALEALTAETTRKCLFITLEMSGRQLYNKLILAKAYSKAERTIRKDLFDKVENPHKDLFKIVKAADAELEGIDKKFIEKVKEAKEFVDKKVDIKEFQLFQGWQLSQKAIINLISQQEKGTLVLIDYIQRMPLTEKVSKERYIQIKELSNALMNATTNSGVVTICGAQFNREAGTDKEGNDTFNETSFRESGDIEQDAHNAIGIGWEADKKTRFYEILKSREGGETGDGYYLTFIGAYSFMEGLQIVHKQKKRKKNLTTVKMNKGKMTRTRNAVAGSNPRRVG